MAKRPLTLDELRERLSGEPDDAVAFLATLHRYPNLRELDEAIRTDRRLRKPLLRVIGRLHEAKGALPSMFRFVPRNDPAFVPPLLEVWRGWNGTISAKAQETLLALGDRRALEAMARLAGKTPPAFRVGPIAALMRLGVDKAYDRTSALALDPTTRWIVLGEVTKKHVAADPRWIDLALRSVDDPDRDVRTRARAIIDELAPAKTKRALRAKMQPAPAAVESASLAAHRAAIAALVAKLPADGFTPARKNAAKQLAALTKILGRIPAAARAFYERVDAIEIPRGKPRDRFIVVSLAEVVADARRWAAAETTQPFHWPVTPDGATKSGFSGGPPYGFEAPTDSDDPVTDAPRKPTFSKLVNPLGRTSRLAGRHTP